MTTGQDVSRKLGESAGNQTAPTTFLSLAPKTSDSYPRTQNKPSQPQSGDYERRASNVSTSSDGSPGLRFLKLGPVHWGEHQTDNQDDWSEVAVE